MSRFCLNNKGVALYIVLTMLLVVVILANVILSLVLSHSRLTHHQVSRIQAYYAAQAGMNYAMEMLRNGTWLIPPDDSPYTNNLCNTNPNCNIDNSSITCEASEAALPCSVRSVTITIRNIADCVNPPPGINACIATTVDYAYTS